MSRVFVLGHLGMLGHTVTTYLRASGHDVVTSNARYSAKPQDLLLNEVRHSGCKWVINAIGAIPQKNCSPHLMYELNALFPLHLLQEMESEQNLIHASTDCVFSGKTGSYRTNSRRDCEQDYGLSKALGETVALDPRALCLRVSLIGPELNGENGLLSWFLNQSGPVEGFTNHIWNGITTLEWAKVADEVIANKTPRQAGLVQLGTTNSMSKKQLLELFSEIWQLPNQIIPTEAKNCIDRTLVPDWIRPPIRQQLLELAAWAETNKELPN